MGLPYCRSKYGYLVVEGMQFGAGEETVDPDTGEVNTVVRRCYRATSSARRPASACRLRTLTSGSTRMERRPNDASSHIPATAQLSPATADNWQLFGNWYYVFSMGYRAKQLSGDNCSDNSDNCFFLNKINVLEQLPRIRNAHPPTEGVASAPKTARAHPRGTCSRYPACRPCSRRRTTTASSAKNCAAVREDPGTSECRALRKHLIRRQIHSMAADFGGSFAQSS